jgi:hypothetical protein
VAICASRPKIAAVPIVADVARMALGFGSVERGLVFAVTVFA